MILASLFKSYLGQDAVHKFITYMIKESKYCSGMMKKHFTKELLMNKKDGANFESSTKCWISGYTFFKGDVKLRDH